MITHKRSVHHYAATDLDLHANTDTTISRGLHNAAVVDLEVVAHHDVL